MIALDTNVMVRYIMQDDIKQALKATQLIESLSAAQPGFVPLVVVVELAWVLSSGYGLSRAQLFEAFESLLRTKELVVECTDIVWKALRVFQSGNADFADCLIGCSAVAAGCTKTMTFDRDAAKSGGMSLLA